MSKKVDTWMPLLIDKYLGDTTDLTTEQHGAYLLLLMTMWKKDGRLPNDDARLASITRLSPSRWKACRAVLMEFFSIDGDRITQKRLSEELTNSKRVTEARAEAGAKGAAKRWQSHSEPIAEPLANASRTDASIYTPSSSLRSEEKSARSARRPPKPQPEPVSIDSLIAEGFAADVAAEFIVHKSAANSPLTPRAWQDHLREAKKAGWTPLQAAEKVMAKGWKGFESKYVAEEPKPTNGHQPPKSFRERDAELAAARVHEMTGGLMGKPLVADTQTIIDMETTDVQRIA